MNDDVADHLAVFDHAHFVACFAVELIEVGHIAHCHDAHAVGAVVGFDHHKRLFVDAVLFVLALDFGQERVDIAAQCFNAHAFCKIDITALAEHGIDEPGVNAQQFAKAFGHFFIALEMHGFATHTPSSMQGR